MIAYGYDNNGIYTGPVNCQIDPLESKKAGETIYLLPASATLAEPPEYNRETQKAVWDGAAWSVEDIPKSQEENKAEARIAELKANLSATDYQAIKYAEGWMTAEEYAPIREQRQAWRDEINELEGE